MIANLALIVSLIIAGIVSMLIFSVSCWVYLQRRTRPYLLLTVALGALVGRSVVGALDVLGHVSHAQHHVIEHGFDMVIAVSLLAAIISMGSPRTRIGRTLRDD